MIAPIELGEDSPDLPPDVEFESELDGLLRGIEADPFEETRWRALCDYYLDRGDQEAHDYAATWVVGNFERARRMQFSVPPVDSERRAFVEEQLKFHLARLRDRKFHLGGEVPATEGDLLRRTHKGMIGYTNVIKGNV